MISVKLAELQKELSSLESATETPLISLDQLRMLFPGESDKAMNKSLSRHCQSGALQRVCNGIWLNLNSRYISNGNLLYKVAAMLRPTEFNYISLESALSERSIISQQMFSYLTVMTTGRSYTYETSLGTIEFTHTKRDQVDIYLETEAIEGEPIRRATVGRAWSDLKRVGRNVGMVDSEELEEQIKEEEKE